MKRTMTWKGTWVALMAALVASPALLPAKVTKPLEDQVRHELLMLPYLGVFDDLSFQVRGDKVKLMGEVTRPVLKSDAGNVIKRLPGVASVDNEIKVLPLSVLDDQVRWRELRAIYGNSALFRYGQGAIPPIHIIVDTGQVTLEGVVDNQTDKDLAGLAAHSVPGVFSVTNNLRVKSS